MLRRILKRTAFLFTLVPALISPSAYASEVIVVKNVPSQPLIPNWLVVSVGEKNEEMLVDQNRVYQQIVSDQTTLVSFVSRLDDPNIQTMTDALVTADCSANIYTILQAEIIDRSSGQSLGLYVFPSEEIEVQIAEENTLIRYAIEYACSNYNQINS